jgi:hypothetical protein
MSLTMTRKLRATIVLIALFGFLLTSAVSDHLIDSRRPPAVWIQVTTPGPLLPNHPLQAELVISNVRPRRLPAGLKLTISPSNTPLQVFAAGSDPVVGIDDLVLPGLAAGEFHAIPIGLRAASTGEHALETVIEDGARRFTQRHRVTVPGIALELAVGIPETFDASYLIVPVAVRNPTSIAAPKPSLNSTFHGKAVFGQAIEELGPQETRTVFVYTAAEIGDAMELSVAASSPVSAEATLQRKLSTVSLRNRTNAPSPCIASCVWDMPHRDALPANGTFPPIPYPIAAALAGEAGLVELTVTLNADGKPVLIEGKGPVAQSILMHETIRWISTNWSWPAGYRSPLRLPRFHFQLTPLPIETH